MCVVGAWALAAGSAECVFDGRVGAFDALAVAQTPLGPRRGRGWGARRTGRPTRGPQPPQRAARGRRASSTHACARRRPPPARIPRTPHARSIPPHSSTGTPRTPSESGAGRARTAPRQPPPRAPRAASAGDPRHPPGGQLRAWRRPAALWRPARGAPRRGGPAPRRRQRRARKRQLSRARRRPLSKPQSKAANSNARAVVSDSGIDGVTLDLPVASQRARILPRVSAALSSRAARG